MRRISTAAQLRATRVAIRAMLLPSEGSVTVQPVETRALPEFTLDEKELRRAAARRPIKRIAGRLLYQSNLYTRLWRGRALIAVFHRIDDRYPTNSITCSTRQFREFCDFFTRYFRVVSLTELLDRLTAGADISRRLAITFDDGYRDNFTFAAAELRKRGLPATFFVTTGFIGTEHTAWWDAGEGIRSEWMTWSEVRRLQEQGFDLGCHTATHADCGQISLPEALLEIVGAKSRLESEINAPVRHFAFPYGSPMRMTEENRAIVQEAGFACCLSAHGGVVSVSDSPFRLCRVPINTWYTSPYQFAFEAARMVSKGPARLARQGE